MPCLSTKFDPAIGPLLQIALTAPGAASQQCLIIPFGGTAVLQPGMSLHTREPIKSSDRPDDWNLLGPALLARAAYALESVLALSDREVDAAVMVRTVYETSVRFAWVAIDPATNARRWLRSDLEWRVKLANDLARFGGKDEAVVRNLKAHLEGLGASAPMPSLDRIAEEADAHCTPRLPDLMQDGATGFRGMYGMIYCPASQSAHGFFGTLWAFVWFDEPGVARVGRPLVGASTQVRLAPFAFGNALAVASVALGARHRERGQVHQRYQAADVVLALPPAGRRGSATRCRRRFCRKQESHQSWCDS